MQVVLTFGTVTLGWAFFRLSEFADIRTVIARVFLMDRAVPYTALNPVLTRVDALVFMLILLVAVLLDVSRRRRLSMECVPSTPRRIVAELVYCNVLIIPLILVGDLGIRDFVYHGF